MVPRRLSRIVVALLTLHLTFVGADGACAEHGDRGERLQSHAHARGMTGGHDHRAVAAVAEAASDAAADQPCETPTQPACCRAMTSCTVTAVSMDAAFASPVPPVRASIASPALTIPLSPVTAPEPPPPKA
jgi:hypothetical protein